MMHFQAGAFSSFRFFFLQFFGSNRDRDTRTVMKGYIRMVYDGYDFTKAMRFYEVMSKLTSKAYEGGYDTQYNDRRIWYGFFLLDRISFGALLMHQLN